MTTFYEFEAIKPVVHPESYVHPSAVVIGDVWIGAGCYIGPFASLRGDFARIRILPGSNVQDGCVIHGLPDHEVVIGENAHVGHQAMIHTAKIGRDALIGMGAIVLDYSEVGEAAIVAAHATVVPYFKVPAKTLLIGSPGKVKRNLSDENLRAKKEATLSYQELSRRSRSSLKPTLPLEKADLNREKISWHIDFDATFNMKNEPKSKRN